MITLTQAALLDGQSDYGDPVSLWEPPAAADLIAMLNHLSARRPREIYLTYVLKLRTRSRRKEQALFQAQVHVTNMTAKVLEELREDPEHPRPDGALAMVHEIVNLRAHGKKGNPTHLLANNLSKRFSTVCSSELFPITGGLRTGVFRQCALILWLWYHDIVAE